MPKLQYFKAMAITKRKPSFSEVRMTELVLPTHTNTHGTIFGGVLMSWIDIAAAIVAQRHSGQNCVTASIDELHFLKPIRRGYVVNIFAKITAVHRTSCEVFVTVEGENPQLGERFHTTTAHLTFVSVDGEGKPIPMPELQVETKEEKKKEREAELRREHRIKLKRLLSEAAKEA